MNVYGKHSVSTWIYALNVSTWIYTVSVSTWIHTVRLSVGTWIYTVSVISTRIYAVSVNNIHVVKYSRIIIHVQV